MLWKADRSRGRVFPRICDKDTGGKNTVLFYLDAASGRVSASWSLLQNEVKTLGRSPEDNSEALDPAVPEADPTFGLPSFWSQNFPCGALRYSESGPD